MDYFNKYPLFLNDLEAKKPEHISLAEWVAQADISDHFDLENAAWDPTTQTRYATPGQYQNGLIYMAQTMPSNDSHVTICSLQENKQLTYCITENVITDAHIGTIDPQIYSAVCAYIYNKIDGLSRDPLTECGRIERMRMYPTRNPN